MVLVIVAVTAAAVLALVAIFDLRRRPRSGDLTDTRRLEQVTRDARFDAQGRSRTGRSPFGS